MTTEISLTDTQAVDLAYKAGLHLADLGSATQERAMAAFARAIEQAVLQSPEAQRLREDAGRLDFFIAEECQLQSLTLGNGTKFRVYWPDDCAAQKEWFTNPRAAIDAAMEQQA